MNPIVRHTTRRRRWFIFILLSFSCITMVALLWPAHEAPLQPVIIMRQPYTIPAPKVGLLDRVMPRGRSWAWLWRLRYAVFGKIKSINLDSTIIDFTGLDTSALAGLLLANPDFAGSDGLRVWRLSEADVRGLRQFFKEKPGQILYSVRDTTGDNTECGTYSGQTAFINGTQQKFGLNVDLLASIRNGTTDLTAVFSFSEAITNSTGGAGDSPYHGAVTVQTNLDFAGRFQLPKEMAGVFVLSAAPASTNHKRIALLLTSSVLQSKK